MFDVGQKVVCVDGSFPHAVLNYMKNLPVEGKVYTVRDLIPAQGWDSKETCALLLVECRNAPAPHRKEWGECGFAPHRFRELNTDEQLAELFVATRSDWQEFRAWLADVNPLEFRCLNRFFDEQTS